MLASGTIAVRIPIYPRVSPAGVLWAVTFRLRVPIRLRLQISVRYKFIVLLIKNMTANKKGFTLIELLVVVSIIGILATLVTANLNAARSRSRDAVRKADFKNLQTALRLYYNDSGSYPPLSTSIPWGAEWSTSSNVYMSKVPNDPLPGQAYTYAPDAANDTFTLTACLENKSDAKCDKDASGNIIACSGDSGCRYSVKP